MGLLLAVAFSKYFKVIGYDENGDKIKLLNKINLVSRISRFRNRYRRLHPTADYKELKDVISSQIAVPLL